MEAYPPPTVTWVHDGIQMFTNQLYTVDNGFTTTDDYIETSVRIKSLSPRLIGKYVCRAQNKLGSNEREILVTQSFEPNCVAGLCGDRFGAAASVSAAWTVVLVAAVAHYFLTM